MQAIILKLFSAWGDLRLG